MILFKKACFILFILFVELSSVVVADDPSISDTTKGVASQVVANGFQIFLYTIADSIIDMAATNSETDTGTNTNRSMIPQMAFMAISYNTSPFDYEWVKDWQNLFMVIYVTAVVCFVIFGGGIMVIVRKMGGNAHRTLSFLFADTVSDIDMKNWMRKLILSIIFGFFATIGIWLILYINDILTIVLSDKAVSIIPFTADNVVAYLILAAGYFVIGIIMAVRQLMLILFVACGLGIAVMYLIPLTENIAKFIFFRMLCIIFLQPILILVATIGLMIIQATPLKYIPFFYIGLVILLVWIAIKIVFGTEFIGALSNTASKVVMLV